MPPAGRTIGGTAGDASDASRLAGLGGVATVLAACGGGAPEALKATDAAVSSPGLLRAPGAVPQAASPTPDATALMNWAEAAYPAWFPGPSPNRTDSPFIYRYYAASGNYIGVAGTEVYVLGPLSGNALMRVGTLADFACQVSPDACTRSPQTAAEAARFLAQATPGATRADISALQSGSYSAWLDTQMAMPRSQGHVDWLLAKGYDGEAFRNNMQGLDPMLWRKFISSPDALRQRMVLALSELLVVSVLGINTAFRQFAIANYLDVLDANAFGNFRTLLEQVTLTTAMGHFLTYRGNAKANAVTGSQPDENYAREVMQLFTIGLVQLNPDGTVRLVNGQPVETYGPDDVSGLARVFTGWDADTSGFTAPFPADIHRRPMTQVPSRYETGSKSFLGVTIAAGTPALTSLRMALDTLFNHPNHAPFISRQLIQRLVTSNPSPAYVGRVAAVYANNGMGVRGDLASVVRAILLDVEARDPAALGQPGFGKLREPVLRFLNWARAFGAASPADAWAIGDLSDPATKLGQSPLRAPSVFNFFRPGYVPPNSALATQGLVAPEFQIATESSVAGYVNYMQRAIAGNGIGDVRVSYTSLTALAADSSALLAEVNLVLAAGQLSAATLATLKAALDTITATTDAGKLNRVQAALLLVMAAPEYIVQK
ncbi:MAG: DUF1800 family protein [Ramlibacter sp.]